MTKRFCDICDDMMEESDDTMPKIEITYPKKYCKLNVYERTYKSFDICPVCLAKVLAVLGIGPTNEEEE